MNRRRATPASRGSSSFNHYTKRAVCIVLIFLLILPGASSSAFWQWNTDGASPRKIKPRVTRPSGPTNVTLYVVSRTELGVTWEPPVFDGGKAISKYLVEWDTDKYMTSGIASPSNPYANSVDGPLVRSEVVSGETEFRIAGLEEGQKYYVRVSAYGDGYSHAISSDPPYEIPAGMLPGFLTDVSLAVASDSETADRLRLAWSAPEFDANGFSVLPSGCAGGASPPSSPDAMEAYRVMWDTHPSLSNAQVYDIPAVNGDGSPQQCCPSGSNDGVCHIELGAEVQSISIRYPQSSIPSGGDLFDSGAVRIAYVGSQSKSMKVFTPAHGSMEVRISPSATLPSSSPIVTGDLIRIQNNVYLVSNVESWPESIHISSEYVSTSDPHAQPETVQASFTTPPSSCFDVTNIGNSAENFRSHISLNFDDSPFDESVTVSRSILMEPFETGDSSEMRVVGYEYHVTFSGQGFSSTLGGNVEELLIISDPSSLFSAVGDCGIPFVSNGVDISSKVSTEVSTGMESGSITPGEKYYVQVAGMNTNGVGPYVPAIPEAEIPRSQPGLAQNCRVYAVPTTSSSLKVEWDGVYPNHGQIPSSYRVDFYDVDAGTSSPVATQVVTDINESTRYSIANDDLIPGTRYKVLIIPVNELGEGGPNWFSDFNPIGLIHGDQHVTPQDYLEKSCHAVPTCNSGSVQCAEIDADNFSIIARSVPPPPKVEVGTYPSVSNQNRFSEDSILVTFESLLTADNESNGIPTDKFLIEWSTVSSFLPSTDDGVDSLWSSEVTAQYSDEDGENAAGEFLIDSLNMGTQYFVRVSAHNTAGYGATTNSVPVKPMTSPDPPFEPMLSSLTPEYITSLHPGSSLSDSAIIGTSLLVSWRPPRVDASNDRPDLVGDGGDEVSTYLVEWSRVSWDNYSPTVFEINLQTASGTGGSDALSILSGSFQVLIDTASSSESVVIGTYASATIPVDISPATLKTILENVPNVGEVEVHSPEPLTLRVTFITELGDIDMSLAENNIFDNAMVAGTVGIAKVSVGTIPANSAYGFEIISDPNELTIDDSIHYIIEHLVPGTAYFVRTSAGNRVGFGPRRKTAPEFSSPLLQRPDDPTSLYSEDVPPYLSVFSPTALKVHIGPPFYDGGTPLTSFLIEWDSSPTFDSSTLGDASSLGSAQVNAASQVCSSCVSDFDFSTNTFAYSGSEVTAKLLIPQRKIMVYFNDDNKSYLFSVLSATSSTITVSSKHLRVSSLGSMRGQDGGLGSNLELLGTTFIIDDLDTERAYYVRVSSENGEMGTGKSILTMPPKETPRRFPLPPSTASVSVIDKNSLNVSWSSDAYMNDPNIQAFKIERFRKSGAASSFSSSFFGEQEVVELSTIGLGLVGGTFHLYFGGLDSSTDIFLGTAKVSKGLTYVDTQVDLSPQLHRGEAIMIGNDQYFVHETDPFTSARLPLSDIYSGDDAETISVFAHSKSMPIAHDATAEEVRNALEQMPNVNHVEVRRETEDAYDGYQWFVTFTTNIGPQPAFSVDTSYLVGTNPLGFAITRTVAGISPDDYAVTVIQDPTVTSFDMENLLTGKPYYIRVSSITDKGESSPVGSLPVSITPGGVPGEISPPGIRPLNENTLLVSFEAAAEANGAPVEEYVIESSSDPSFSGSSRMTIQPNHKVQRITTRAHTLPWGDSSSFTLSLGDFHGDFTVPVGQGTTTVRVQNGDNILERSTGTISLSSAVARGDFLSVGGVEFRVCLSHSHPYDDSHISLCSKDGALEEANFYVDNPLNIIDELPIFLLDTSLGAAKSPAVGDIFLSTVDASGSPKDTRIRLRRGDLIRVGHPDFGETFRISTDSGRDFTDRVIPLGSADDANTAASLSSKALEHSTYEVQSFYIRSNTDSVTLTPSNVLSSGFRVRFLSESTQSTTAGGANGCLRWDSTAKDVEMELESLRGIDSVIVTKEDLSPLPGGLGAGVKYYVTFTGLNVRGNIPPLQIVDVGSNGCLDAHLLGGNFGEDIAPIVVAQVETPYVPFYEIQTTIDIPYDASSADMKAALEALSQACTVDVSRKINRHGYAWDITFQDSSYPPLLPLSANGANLSADIDPGVSVVDIQEVQVSTETGGTPYFVRVAALNIFGMGPFTLSNPRATEVSPQPPSEPVDVFAEAISDTEILVQWNPPLETGGRSVTHYKIEYDELSSFTSGQNSGPFGSVSLSSSSISTISDVQSITVKIDDEGLLNNEAYLSGTFSLSFDGQKTSQLPYNASPEKVKASLEALCNIHEVHVARSLHCSPDPSIGCMTPEGYSWLVTFVGVESKGDQHHRPMSKLSSSTSHKLSAEGSYLFECSDVTRGTCSIGGSSVANVGTLQEVQRITVASSPFSVSVGGETSDVINIGDSISDVEEKLNSYSKNGVGKISVTCVGCAGDAINSGDSILLYFSSFRGDLPPVIVSDPAASISEVTKGSSQYVIGRASYSTVISGLTSVHDWYVRVFAYNGVGEGLPELAWPSPLRLTAVAPQIPENVAVTVQSATSLQVSWDRPSSIGGAQLSSFTIEYDTSPAFTTQNGVAMGHLVVAEADADASISIVSDSYPNSSDPILRKRIMIHDADVISQGIIGVGSMLVIDGLHLTVSSINEESCGVTCLTITTDYTGTTGMKIYSGLNAKQYNFPITGLIPGTAYFVRVAAVNEKSMGPFAFAGYPFSPISSTPMDVPAALSWASMSAVSEDKLRVDYGSPSPSLSDKPYGVNGSPTSKYHLEVATGAHEVQELQITSTTTLQGAFGLVFGGDSCCIDVGAPAGTVKQALESLSAVDGVSIAISEQSSSLLRYEITFNGPSVANKDHPLLEIDYSAVCAPSLDGGIEIKVRSLQEGAEVFRPEIVSLSTSADMAVSGYIELSVGYQGNYEMLVSVGNQPAQFMVGPGSRWVNTMGDDLSSVLHPGETIVIGEEFVQVQAVSVNKIELEEYHIRGTDGVAVPGFRMDNYIGSATISLGDNTLAEANGKNLESVLRPGEVVEVTNDAGGKEYLTVISITGSSVIFSPNFTGSTTTTPIYARKKVIAPANSSSAAMQAAVESLNDVGTVEVTREGPNSFEGFTFHITFSSNMGISSCSLPSWCFASSTESITYISVSGLNQECDGNYVQTSFHDGRPRYELLGKSCFVLHESASLEWRLYHGTSSVMSSVSSTDVYIPLSGWSNGANIALSAGTIPLLLGQNAAADVSILQEGVQQSFKNVVFSAYVDVGQLEVQEVELLSDEDDVRGSYELSLGTVSQKIILYHDETTEDFTSKLQSLSGIGSISVDSAEPPEKFGRIWLITYLSNSGDVPLLRHHGTSNLQGTGVSLNISEKVKGSSGQQHIVVNDLEEGILYAGRMYAENDAGAGPYTTTSQSFGGGIHPMALSVSSPPGPPSLVAGIITKSRAEVKFTEPSSNGSEILSYKFEWTTSSTFGSLAQANARVSCSDGSEILGYYRLMYGHDIPSRSETSVPIDIRSNTAEISQALNSFEFLNEVEASIETNEPSQLEWAISFLHDVGPMGALALDTENLRCQSEEPLVDSTITMTTPGSIPTDYGSKEVFTNEVLCGSMHLGEYSAVQRMTLAASSDAVTGGSYKLMLDSESSDCIPFGASATQMKNAIQGFEHAGEVDVIASTAPNESNFPYEYNMVFKGNYAYGDWPALQVNPSHFGAGECAPFVGGVDHRASILPIRDESLCLNGADNTVAIVADSITSVGGTFAVSYGHDSSVQVSLETTASEMKDVLTQLVGSNVHVTRHNHDDMGEGVAWAVAYPGTSNKDAEIRIVDTFDEMPRSMHTQFSLLNQNDSSGDFRIVIDGESTAPLSHQASHRKILQEMHRLNGIGKVNMLGPVEGEESSLLELSALIDDSLTTQGLKAIAIVGDLTSTFAEGDPLMIGACELEIKSVFHEVFDQTLGAGFLYESLYSSSPETARAKTHGYSIFQIKPSDEALNFVTDCSQDNGVSVTIQIGSVLKTDNGVNHSMIIKSYAADLDAIKIIPETNWRGTAPRIFFKPPSGLAPHTFTMTGIDKEKLIIRASARNSLGFGPPSDFLEILPTSTVPSAPSSVMLRLS
ncbi:LOW QUALITY PROTEIN: hypothetical protein ACHAXR_012985 [Thalassiosira sp. AJA248-18]